MNYKDLSEQVQNHVLALYHQRSNPALLYHTLAHTQRVVAAAVQIANHYQLNDRDFFVVTAAAWFHDIGYLDGPAGHEQNGAQQAADFLARLQAGQADIDSIRHCILATKLPQNAQNLLEEIVCDADLFHLGTDGFSDTNRLMRKEYKALNGTEISKEEWRRKTIALLQQHHYYTDYCRVLLDPKKGENLANLLHKQQAGDTVVSAPSKLPADGNDASSKKADRPDKGIETMFRISSNNHQRLSDMADNKSHIIITVNSIIISVVVSLLLDKLNTASYMIIPAVLLLLVSLVAIVLSILAARPTIPNGTFSQEDLDEKKVNLLFFGNFYKMSIEHYAQGMRKVMEDRDFLYGTLIRDVYSQGVVLGRKYKLLRASYNVFMYGLVLAVIAFIVASFLTTPL
ncbi:MAG: HD domain-containing protein [Williamsia sp.]|nr:HD domain-containing protein [Williamsia sp.]